MLVALASCLPGQTFAADTDRLYAVCFNGSYPSYTAPWITGPDNATGKIYLYLLDAATGQQAASIFLDEPAYYVAVSLSGKRIGLTSGQSKNVTIVNANLTTLAKAPLNTPPWGIAFSPDSSVLYAALPDERAIVVLDALTGEVSARIPLEYPPYNLAVSPDGKRLYAANTLNDSFTAIDTARKRPLVTVPAGVRPMDIVASPDGASIYVAVNGNDAIIVYDTVNYPVKAVIDHVSAPAYLALDARAHRLYATSFEDGSIAVIDTKTGGVAGVWPTGVSRLGRPTISGDGGRLLVPDLSARGIVVYDTTSAGRIGGINLTGPVTATALYTVPPGEPFYVSPTPAPALTPISPKTSPVPTTGSFGLLSSDPATGKITLRPITQNDILFILLLFAVVLIMLCLIIYFMMFKERKKEE